MLNFPEFSFDIRDDGQNKQIFDSVRKKFIPLTPEEWVRQHCIRFFEIYYRIPLHRMAVERSLTYNKMRKRFDLIVFSKSGQAACLVECKAPQVLLNAETAMQAGMYNTVFNSPYIWLTNGMVHFWIQYQHGKASFCEFPENI